MTQNEPKLKMKGYSPYILEAWAAWEMLRKLGFAADDIFWIFVNTLNAVPRPGLALNIQLKTQDKELMVTCSTRLSEGAARRLERDSRRFQEELNADRFDELEMTKVLQSSFAWRNRSDFLMALVLKGFVFPYKFDA